MTIACRKAQARWALIAQAIGFATSVALSPTLLHWPIAVYGALYGPV